MKILFFKFNDLEIWQEEGKFYALYDAGTHVMKMRKDEISKEEAEQARLGDKGPINMLFALQKRLIKAGVNPYESNVPL